MGFRIDVGVDSERNMGPFVHSSGDLVDDLKFMQRLAVEGKNILFESVFDLFVTLADAGKNDL